MPSGTLYVVATPIGSLEDITLRAIRILKEVDLIACEDTRHTRRLLDHYGIDRPAISYHEHNEPARSEELIARLESGSSVALVSDAGTPLVSDPGYRIVHAATVAGIPVVPVPGPSAVVTALSASGLATDSFYFGGFLPAKTAQRRRRLEQLRALDCTLVFYEAPHRIVETLADVAAVLGPRGVVLTRELTKVHEEFLRGAAHAVAAELERRPSIRGEMTLLIGKAEGADARAMPPVLEAVEERIAAGKSPMDAIKEVARERGLAKRDVYTEYEHGRRGAEHPPEAS